MRTLSIDSGETVLTFSPDGKTLAIGSKTGVVKLWDVVTGESTVPFVSHGGAIGALRYSADGAHLIAIFDDKAGMFSAEDKQDYGEVYIAARWNMQSHELENSFRLRGEEFFNFDISPDGRLITVCAKSYTYGNQLTLWVVSTGKLLRAHNLQESDNYTVNFSPDSKDVLASSLFGKVMLWDIKEGTFKIVGKDGFNMILSPSRKIMAGIGESGGVRLYSIPSGNLIRELPQHSNEFWGPLFSPDGRTLAIGASEPDSRVRLWNIETFQLVSTLSGHTEGIANLAFSPDSEFLASVDMQGKIILWHAT